MHLETLFYTPVLLAVRMSRLQCHFHLVVRWAAHTELVSGHIIDMMYLDMIPPRITYALQLLLCLRKLLPLHILVPHLLFRVPWLIALLQHRPIAPDDRPFVLRLLSILPELGVHILLSLLLLCLFSHLAHLLAD